MCCDRLPWVFRPFVSMMSHLIFLGFFIESSPQVWFEGKWLQHRLQADKNESRSLMAVDIQGHQHGDFCIVPISLGDKTQWTLYLLGWSLRAWTDEWWCEQMNVILSIFYWSQMQKSTKRERIGDVILYRSIDSKSMIKNKDNIEASLSVWSILFYKWVGMANCG